MNILLVGEIYSDNLGDPLICQNVETIIKESLPSVNIIKLDMSGRIDSSMYYEITSPTFIDRVLYKLLISLKPILKHLPVFRIIYSNLWCFWRVRANICEIKKSNHIDLVLFAGGQIFYDFFVGIIYLITNQFKKTNTIFHACGMGNLSNDSIKVLKKILKRHNIKSISLRDSLKKFNEHFITQCNVFETYDTALCSPFYFNAHHKKQPNMGSA